LGCCCNADGTWNFAELPEHCGECFVDTGPGQGCIDAENFCPNVDVACCDSAIGAGCVVIPGVVTKAICLQAGGVPHCPALCLADTCDGVVNPSAPCCLPGGQGDCQVLLESDCIISGGQWFPSAGACSEVTCLPVEGCRLALEPAHSDGDPVYTADTCETVVVGFSNGGDVSPDGEVEIASTHPARAVWSDVKVDPCRYAFGGLFHDDRDGNVYPAMCSQPDQAIESQRWNLGYFTRQTLVDDPDRVDVGHIHGRVGVEPPRWSEIGVYQNWLGCGVDA